MTYPTIIIVYLIFIITLEAIQVAALLYYIWTLCIKPHYIRSRKKSNIDSVNRMPLIEMEDYIEL